MADPSPAPGSLTMASASGRWVLLACILGSALAGIDATVVNVALPALGRSLGAGFTGLQWTVSAYALTLASFILLGGTLGDRFGRRRVFLVGVVWFATASLVCGLSVDIEMLIGARALQGVGAALLTPGSLSLLQVSFRASDRGRAIGAWSGLGGVATAIGPLIGGWLVEVASWRWVFLVNVPLAVLVVVVALRHVPESRDTSAADSTVDWGGGLLGAVALGGLSYALIERGSAAPVALGIALVGAVAFGVRERRAAYPVLPLPVTVLMLLLSARSGALASRLGPRLQMSVGPFVAAAGLLWLSRVGQDSRYLVDVLPGLVLFGLGLVTMVAPLTAAALGAAPAEHAGMASGVNNAVARTGQLLSVAAVPSLVGLSGGVYDDPLAFTAGYAHALWIAAGALAVGGVLAASFVRNDVLEDTDGTPEPAPVPPHR